MRVQDRRAVDEIWIIFEKSFKSGKSQVQVATQPKKEAMKFDTSRPWYEQLGASKSKKKNSGESSSDSSSSDDEPASKKAKPNTKSPVTNGTKRAPLEPLPPLLIIPTSTIQLNYHHCKDERHNTATTPRSKTCRQHIK